MKRQIFTLLISALIGTALYAQSGNFGTGWTLQTSTYLVLDEDFTGFPFVHSDDNPDMGNSDNLDTLNPGYIDTILYVKAMGSSFDTISLDFYQCAFAPNWMPAYWYQDSVNELTITTPAEVSRGFVEISREYESWATINGHLIIDLSEVRFIEAIQFSHSSCGGNKRGFTLAASTDYGVTWDTVMVMTGNSTTSDPSGYDCQESARGMLWELGLYMGSLVSPGDSVLLRFTKPPGFVQAVRLHDLKIYGEGHSMGIGQTRVDRIKISVFNGFIRLSEPADIQVYGVNGMLVRQAQRVESLYIRDLPSGIYIVKAKTDGYLSTRKIFN